MEQRGLVIKTDNQYAYVKIRRESACGSNCAHCAGCELKEIIGKAINIKGAKAGDFVRLDIDAKPILFAAFVLYILPLLLGLILGISVFIFYKNIIFSVTGGIATFFLLYLMIYEYNKKLLNNEKYIGVITEILS